MATRNGNGNGNGGNGNGRNGNGGNGRNVISKSAPRYTSAAAHAEASRAHSRMAAFHSGEAARLARNARDQSGNGNGSR